jgi:hypothetical protein
MTMTPLFSRIFWMTTAAKIKMTKCLKTTMSWTLLLFKVMIWLFQRPLRTSTTTIRFRCSHRTKSNWGGSQYSRYGLSLTFFSSAHSQPVLQLRSLANKIVNSPTIKADLQECCVRSQIKPALMIQDVSTRWNSTSELIGRALYLRPALQMLVIMREHNKTRGVRLHRFQLSEAEWNVLVQLHPLLEVGPLLMFMFVR